MLDHLKADHCVEGFANSPQILGTGDAVVDGRALGFRMATGNGNRIRRGIDPRYPSAEAGERFADKPTSAADIKNCYVL